MSTRYTLTDAQREQIAGGRFVRLGPPFGGVLVGRAAGTLRAYRNECRHRALPLDLGSRSPMSDDGTRLLCNQHGALYRLEDGLCVVGPCTGDSLQALAVREEDDAVVVG